MFQPIVDLHAWRVVGVEALARFDDGRWPLDHLAAAEARGERQRFELRLLATAVEAARALPKGILVTLNASGSTMLAPELAELLARVDRPWGLELFEGPTAAPLTEIRDRVTALGGRLLVDDAGSASADVARIIALRPDVVKIDREVFWRATADARPPAALHTLLDAARSLGSQVLVEGIEDAAHVDLARELGATLGQGFHLGRPSRAEDVATMLDDLERRIGMNAPRL